MSRIKTKWWKGTERIDRDSWEHIPIWLRCSERYKIDSEVDDYKETGAVPLAPEEVRAIRRDTETYAAIARKWKVSPQTVKKIKKRLTYIHVGDKDD